MRQEPRSESRPVQRPELIDRNENGGQDSERQEVSWRYASQLWVDTRRRLWPRQYFSPENQERGRIAMQKMFLLAPIDRYGRLYEIWLFRICLVMLHWEREFGEKIPEPTVFFDIDNPNGFAITRDWPKDEKRYPAQPVSYKNKRRLMTQSSGKRGDLSRLGNLFQ
jgi:hypothetical protein